MESERLPETVDFVAVGIILKAHGLRGEVKVRPFTQSSDSLVRYRQLYLGREETTLTPHICEQGKGGGAAVILRLAGCTDRDEAECLVGQLVWLSVADLPPTGVDEFYLHTLIGKQGKTIDGQALGRVVAVIGAGCQDILVIRNGVKEVLVPAVRNFIREIGEDQVVFDLPPGLLEIND